jgi:hypothetical protein
MNFKLIFKALFIIAVLSLLVIMGMYNRRPSHLSMPNILPRDQALPAALMYLHILRSRFPRRGRPDGRRRKEKRRLGKSSKVQT